jgi:arginyl-tRNA synthetase
MPTNKNKNNLGNKHSTFPHNEGNIIIDYSGPNISKSMHMGHLRSTLVGQGLKNLLKYCEARVVGDIHYGDLGKDMASMLRGLKSASNKYDVNELFERQKEVALKAKGDPSFSQLLREEALKIQQNDTSESVLAQSLTEFILSDLKKLYKDLCIDFEQEYGERRYIQFIDDTIALFKNHLVTLNPNQPTLVQLNNGLPPVFLRGEDGFLAYSSIDMAAIYDRIYNQKASRIIYVAGNRQIQHWKQIISAWDLLSLPVKMEHKALGKILNSEGEPYKHDPYFGLKLSEFIKELKNTINDEITQTYPALADSFHFIFLGILKLNEYSHAPEEDYIFEIHNKDHWDFLLRYRKLKNQQKNWQYSSDEPFAKGHLSKVCGEFSEVIEHSVEKLDLSPLYAHLMNISKAWERTASDDFVYGNVDLNLSIEQAQTIFKIFGIE